MVHQVDGTTFKVHTADVLCQVEGTGVVRNGWVGDDNWVDSVVSCIYIRKKMKVHSTFIVKNSTSFFPMKVLHKILQVQYGNFWPDIGW